MLFGIVEAECRGIYVDVGRNGRANSNFNVVLEDNIIHFPENGVYVGYFAFPFTVGIPYQ